METINTPEELHTHEMNEYAKSLSKPKRTRKKKVTEDPLMVVETNEPKPCVTCKKKKIVKLPEYNPMEDFFYSGEELRQVYAYLLENSKLKDPNIAEYTKRIFKDVTGFELSIQGCLGCQSAKWRRMFRIHAKQRYNVDLK